MYNILSIVSKQNLEYIIVLLTGCIGYSQYVWQKILMSTFMYVLATDPVLMLWLLLLLLMLLLQLLLLLLRSIFSQRQIQQWWKWCQHTIPIVPKKYIETYASTKNLCIPTYESFFPPMTMAVLEADGEPLPAPPGPLSSQRTPVTPHPPLTIFPSQNQHKYAKFKCLETLVHSGTYSLWHTATMAHTCHHTMRTAPIFTLHPIYKKRRSHHTMYTAPIFTPHLIYNKRKRKPNRNTIWSTTTEVTCSTIDLMATTHYNMPITQSPSIGLWNTIVYDKQIVTMLL